MAKKLSEAKHPIVIGGDEASASTNGASSIEAIYALNLLVGNINKEGGLIINPSSPLEDMSGSRIEGQYNETLKLLDNIKSGSIKTLFLNDIDLNYYLGWIVPFVFGAIDFIKRVIETF